VRIAVNNRLAEEMMELSIIDTEGRLYHLESISLFNNIFDLSIEKSVLSPGIYSLRLAGLSGVYTGKIIIQ